MPSVSSILFVCSGNICRSPLAEAVLRHKLERRGLADRFRIDSAGTVSDHLGQQADSRMRRTAAAHGVTIRHRARRVTRADFADFDLIVGMDDWHISTLESMNDASTSEIRKLREFDPEVGEDVDRWTAPDVPDPWYGGMGGFEQVYEMVDRSCESLADELERRV
jgi:protein-tyrosine phosphatase